MYFSTIISRRASDILAHLSRIQRTYDPSLIPLYALSASPHLAADDLSALVKELNGLSPRGVGCLSAPLPVQGSQLHGAIACSVALYDPGDVTPFRSTLPGKAAPQVGRWHAFRKHTEGESEGQGKGEGTDPVREPENVDWQRVWSQNRGRAALPQEIQELDLDAIKSVVYFSDNAHEGLSNSLHGLRSATKVGMIASSTPFVTGRPFTLFHGSNIHSSGAVGICLTEMTQPRSFMEIPGLVKLTEPMVVTGSDGNLVHSLNNQNPSRLLLNVIQKNRDVSAKHSTILENVKEDQYFLAALEVDRDGYEIAQLYTISGGDPSRGTMSLEGDTAPLKGALVQIHKLPVKVSLDVLNWYSRVTTSAASRMAFSVASFNSNEEHISEAIDGGNSVVLDNTFVVASENGFVLDRQVSQDLQASEVQDSRPWRCTVRGGMFGLEW